MLWVRTVSPVTLALSLPSRATSCNSAGSSVSSGMRNLVLTLEEFSYHYFRRK